MKDNKIEENNLSSVELLYKTFSNAGEGILDLTQSKKQLDILKSNIENSQEEKNENIELSSNQINSDKINNLNLQIVKEKSIFVRIKEFLRTMFKK